MFSVFAHYPTFLVFLAIVIAAALTMAFMPLWIRMLRSSHIGQQVRADGPQSHLVKQGTPTVGDVVISVPWLYLVFVDILLMGLCNAVNLTDGLDGLAAGTVMIVMLVMAAIAYRSGMLDPAVFAAALAGSCIGFLWFNSYPADIFMGDTGSLALGMALGCLAVLTKSEFIVLIIGGLFVVEALSVMLQVFYFKRTGKRLFLMAPLHHHFEKKGWKETRVVVRFWIISGVLSAIGFFIYFAESLMAVS